MDINAYMLMEIGKKLGAFDAEICTSIMRRQYIRNDGKQAEVVDFYPELQSYGYGRHKFCMLYIDTCEDRAMVNAMIGGNIESIDVYDSDASYQRKAGNRHRLEVGLPRPILIITTPSATDNSKKYIQKWMHVDTDVNPVSRVPTLAETHNVKESEDPGCLPYITEKTFAELAGVDNDDLFPDLPLELVTLRTWEELLATDRSFMRLCESAIKLNHVVFKDASSTAKLIVIIFGDKTGSQYKMSYNPMANTKYLEALSKFSTIWNGDDQNRDAKNTAWREARKVYFG